MIDPNAISTIRVEQLGTASFSLTDNIPHEVSGVLKKGTIQSLSDFIASVLGTSDAVGYYPLAVVDGQQLPEVPENPSFFLCGKGTFLNINGFDDLVCSEELNVIMSLTDHWEIAIEIPINVDPLEIGISQTINSGVMDFAPSEDAVFNSLHQWLNTVGSFHYADLTSQTTPQTTTSNVPLKILNDSDGADTNISNAPYAVSTLYSSVTNKLNFTELAIGDLVTFRPDLSITTSGANKNIKVYLKMAIGSGDDRILDLCDIDFKDAGVQHINYSVPFDIANNSTRLYPAELWVVTDDTASIVNNGYYFSVLRKNINIAQIVIDGDNTKLAILNNLSDLEDVETAKTNLGLENVDNTADVDKPVSTAQTTAIDAKVSDTSYNESSWNGVTTIAPSKNAVRDKIESLATITKQYNTYFINTATGNNATGVFEDASKPFQNIDYVTALPSYAGGVFELQNNGTFVINNTIPDFDVSIRSDKSCTLDFSSNSNTNLIPTASTTKNYEINLPFGIVRNEKSGASGSCFNSLGTGNIIFKAKELYSNQSNNFINYFASTIFEVEKVSGRTSVLATVDNSTNRSCNDINLKHFVCLTSNSCLNAGAGNSSGINIGLISGTGSYRFQGGKYEIGDITTTGTCQIWASTTSFLHLNFKNSIITSTGGIELGNGHNSAKGVVITGNIASCPLIFATAVTNILYNYYFTKFINFSANFETGTYNQNHGNVFFENCSIKSTNSPITLGGGTTYNSRVEIKNSTFEVVNAVPLVTGGASSGDTLKIAGVSTNSTMLSDQSGTGVTVTQFTNY